MSYDIILRPDGDHPGAAEQGPLREAIAAALGCGPAGQLAWREGEEHVSFDLLRSGPGGDAPPDRAPGTPVSRIECHVSAKGRWVLQRTRRVAARAVLAAAEASGWSAFDPQLEEPFDTAHHRWPAELLPPASRIDSVSVSPDGSRIAFATGGLEVWSRETGLPEWRLDAGHEVREAVWLDCDTLALQRRLDGREVVQRCPAGEEPGASYRPRDLVRRMEPAGGGRLYLSSGELLDLDGPEVLGGVESMAGPMAYSPGSGLLALWQGLWDTGSGRRLLGFAESDPGLRIRALALSPDGGLLAAGGSDGRIVLRDTTTLEKAGEIGRCGRVSDLRFSPDGSLLAAAADSPNVRLWSPSTCRVVRTLGAPGDFVVWDSNSGRRLPGEEPDGRQTLRLLFPGGGRLVSTHLDGRCRFWDFEAGELLGTLGFLPGGEWLVTAPGAFDHSEGFRALRWTLTTDSRFSAECLTLEGLEGSRVRGLLGRLLPAG